MATKAKVPKAKVPKAKSKSDLVLVCEAAYNECVRISNDAITGYEAKGLSNLLRRAEDAINNAINRAPFKNRKYNLISSYVAGVYIYGVLSGFYVSPNLSTGNWRNDAEPSYIRRGNSAAIAYIKQLKPRFGKHVKFSVIFAVAMPYASIVSRRYSKDLLKPAVDDFIASGRAMKLPYRANVRSVMRTFNY